ncbi:hypothetical protein [Streptomyces massasporeus]|uniref:hypothetical protein n=1 Tax=Streptomyces massasporeus TaxID=67324 RepID=UPI0033E93033
MPRSIALFTSFLHLDQSGRVQAERPVFDAERDGWQVMTFHVETDADVHGDHWEVHSDADEVVACLAGGIRLCFHPERLGRKTRSSRRRAPPRQSPGEADRSTGTAE